MKANPLNVLCFVFSLVFAGALHAKEFESIFDGKSLKGWKALNMSYWSVKDGAITAESTKKNPCTSNQFLVWQGGDVSDFELKLKFRVTGNGCNSTARRSRRSMSTAQTDHNSTWSRRTTTGI